LRMCAWSVVPGKPAWQGASLTGLRIDRIHLRSTRVRVRPRSSYPSLDEAPNLAESVECTQALPAFLIWWRGDVLRGTVSP
jgi:hypothetical protein